MSSRRWLGLPITIRPSVRRAAQVNELELWAVSVGATLMADVDLYEVSRVAGAIQSLRIDPAEGVLQVIISDGTALVTAQWSLDGSIPVPELIPGRLVVLDGVATFGHEGNLFEDPLIAGVALDPIGSSE